MEVPNIASADKRQTALLILRSAQKAQWPQSPQRPRDPSGASRAQAWTPLLLHYSCVCAAQAAHLLVDTRQMDMWFTSWWTC
jgi:hypothetical protein